jgi:hypothetical protein
MLSRELCPGPRDVMSTAMKPENRIAVRRIAEMASDNGHIVIRAEPNGGKYTIYTVTNADESGRVTATFGPYEAT